MFGGGSIQIARVFGIRIGVHPTWFIALFLFIWWLTDMYEGLVPEWGSSGPFILGVISALLFFASIVLHELGHSVVALRNKIGISGIDLWLFGGVAKMERDSPNAGAEFRVAAAGPFVTALIVGVCIGISLAAGATWTEFWNASPWFRDVGAPVPPWWLVMLSYLATINFVLLVFNLVPAYPLDGGRIARSIAWALTNDKSKATNFAAELGRGFGIVLIGFGIFEAIFWHSIVGGLWLVLLGFLLYQAAAGARAQQAVTSRLEGLKVADIMERDPVSIPEDLGLDRAEEEYVLRYRYPWFPVVDRAQRYIGLIASNVVEHIDPARRASMRVVDVMDAGQTALLKVEESEDVEALLGRTDLQKIGALMVVDAAGHLQGIVTVNDLRRLLVGGRL